MDVFESEPIFPSSLGQEKTPEEAIAQKISSLLLQLQVAERFLDMNTVKARKALAAAQQLAIRSMDDARKLKCRNDGKDMPILSSFVELQIKTMSFPTNPGANRAPH